MGTPCWASPTFHPFSRAWCVGLSSLCPHSDASATQPTSKAVHHWFNSLLYPKWKLNLKAVMFEVIPSTILFYFHVPDLTSVTWYLPFQQETFTRSCQKQEQTKTSRQLSFPLPRRKHTCFLGEAPRKCNGLWSTILNGNSKSHWYHMPSVSRHGYIHLKNFWCGFWGVGWFLSRWSVHICFVYSFLVLKRGKLYSLARNALTPLTLRKYRHISRLDHIFCLKVSLRLLALSTVSRNVFSSQSVYIFKGYSQCPVSPPAEEPFR